MTLPSFSPGRQIFRYFAHYSLDLVHVAREGALFHCGAEICGRSLMGLTFVRGFASKKSKWD